ncbi:ATP-binding cassette domain-containing protein [Planctomycetota bacterium]
MIEINELTKWYEDSVLALDHVSYTVEPGEIFCLSGANGAGKTTTINILMDKPTSGLDPTSAQEFLDQLRRLRERSKAILMTTHDIFRAKIIADRVGIMKQGRLVAVRKRQDFKHADLEQIYMREMQTAEAVS